MAEKCAGYSNFRTLTRGALTVGDRGGVEREAGTGSDINIALPKRNTLSRGKFPPEDQGSKLLKSLPGVPNSTDFDTVRHSCARKHFEKAKIEVDQKSLCKIKYVRMGCALSLPPPPPSILPSSMYGTFRRFTNPFSRETQYRYLAIFQSLIICNFKSVRMRQKIIYIEITIVLQISNTSMRYCVICIAIRAITDRGASNNLL